MKFNTKIVLASALLIITTTFVLSSLQIRTTKDSMTRQINSGLTEIISSVGNTVDIEINSKLNNAQLATKMIQHNPLDESYVEQVLKSDPVLNAEFQAVGIGYEHNGSLVINNGQVPDNYDARTRPWYQSAKRSIINVTEPYIDAATQQMIISIGTPVYSSSEFVGAMVFDVNLGIVSKMINRANLFDSGSVFVISDKGITISHPEQSNNGEHINTWAAGIRIIEGIQEFEENGRTYQVMLKRMQGENWYIGALIDQNLALSGLSKIVFQSVITTLICVIVAIALLKVLISFLLKPLGKLNDALERVANNSGDLTTRLETKTDKEFSELAKNFNRFIGNLHDQLKRSSEISNDIEQLSNETNRSANETVSAMTTQQQELEQLVTAMDELSSTASSVAENAQEVLLAVDGVDASVGQGLHAVEDTKNLITSLSVDIDNTVTEINNLKESSESIDTIIKVISDISDQTNLLALNAAIEAARAGDAGRGFAVVADEVRALASRTQGATIEISEQIEQLQIGATSAHEAMANSKANSTNAVEKAVHAHELYSSIRTSVGDVSNMNSQIAAASEEQRVVTDEMNRNALNIKDLCNETLSKSENATEAMHKQDDKIKSLLSNIMI
ncbi:methyl-accepting chemotaxis protein [Vibrio sp.]|uniref:methyl-accepting chemotaxis protein n=1 Tax=Vibrio sp. TaxID=678 RepID=UPI0037AFE8E4